ncbi:MAG: lipopolysaccharide heptosyltransferase II [Burkholderiales bacterium]|nr:lipopolysaccharide heptosyltransferase II [Burkholderiales bacterium]MDE2078371.1 lipopolysaccharide heptosyltransferase II [Burkholderiales bacterium]MDE2433991.1 lipopolysaccharide heptosyltransferase II [Burkholderiales bacterium]
MTPTSPAATPRRILIVRLSALGDIVMASGLMPALHKHYPQAELYWLTEAGCAPLLKHNPKLKDVLIWPRAQWEALLKSKQYGALWREICSFRKMLRSYQFDLALDGQGLLKSGLCTWFTGAPRRLSIIAREGSHLLVHERVVPPPGADIRIGSEYRYLATYLGAAETDFQLDLAVGAQPRQRAQQVLQQALGTAPVRPLVVLCPFTTRPQKHWVEDNWAQLAQQLWQQGFQPLFLGGPADQEAAQRIASACPNLINLTGKLKLDESVALISLCQQLIGVDTGLTHMGTALRLPTVALFGSTRPYLSSGTPTTHVMYDALPCSPCRRRPTCDGRFDCMKQLTVERVLAQANALLPPPAPTGAQR